MISNGMEIIGAWTESILLVFVFTCGTVNMLLFDIAGQVEPRRWRQ